MSMNALPAEVVHHVVEYLPFSALTQFRLTSRRYCVVSEYKLFDTLSIDCIGETRKKKSSQIAEKPKRPGLSRFSSRNSVHQVSWSNSTMGGASGGGGSSDYAVPFIEPFLERGDCDLYCEPPGFLCEHACYQGKISLYRNDDINEFNALANSNGLAQVKRIMIMTKFAMGSGETQEEMIKFYNKLGWFMTQVVPEKCPKLQLVDLFSVIPGFHDATVMNTSNLLDRLPNVEVNTHLGFAPPGQFAAPPPLRHLLMDHGDSLKILSLQVFPFEVSYVLEFLNQNLVPASVERLDITQLECDGGEEALRHFVSQTTTLKSLNLIESLTLLDSPDWFPKCTANMILWDYTPRDHQHVNNELVHLAEMKSVHFQTETGNILCRLNMPELQRLSICATNPWERAELEVNWTLLFATSNKIQQLVCNNMKFSTVANVLDKASAQQLESLAIPLANYSFPGFEDGDFDEDGNGYDNDEPVVTVELHDDFVEPIDHNEAFAYEENNHYYNNNDNNNNNNNSDDSDSTQSRPDACFEHLVQLAESCAALPRLRFIMLELRYVTPEQLLPVIQAFVFKCPQLQEFYVDVDASHHKSLLKPVHDRYVVDGISRLPVHESEWHSVMIPQVPAPF